MKENEIRPQDIFNEYLKLAEQDIVTYFNSVACTEINCPACGAQGNFAFEKKCFSYQECPECLTLFVSPRPEKKAFDRYYTDSPSTKYWATTFYRETECARREKLWKPKALLIKEKLEQFLKAEMIIDIGGGYGTFAEEILKILDVDVLVIEPSMHLAKVCREKGLNVLEKFLEEVTPDMMPKKSKCYVSFELFEHLYDAEAFLGTVYRNMEKNDLFIFTTLSGRGVDIQVLWENSKSVSPPHHLNFFNPKSVQMLLNRLNFNVLEIATPGKLDINIMENNLGFIKDRFWNNYLKTASEQEKERMQAFISENLLSSHMMIVCSKK